MEYSSEKPNPSDSNSINGYDSDDDSATIDDSWFDEDIKDENKDKINRCVVDDEILLLMKQNNIDSLYQALYRSLYNEEHPRPLALLLYHEKSIAANIFCDNLLGSKTILNCLRSDFVTWSFDRTRDIDYEELLTILACCVGLQVANIVQLTDIDQHPLFVCLSFQNGKIVVASVIKGVNSEHDILSSLQKAREIFDTRVEMALQIDEILVPVSRDSTTFMDLVNLLQLDEEAIIKVDEVHNRLQTQQYLACKENIYALVGHYIKERILFHGCSLEAALQIVNRGFAPNCIGFHGSQYDHGFHFSSSQRSSNLYSTPDNLTHHRTMLVCRVLIGGIRSDHETMKTCPDGFESTTDLKETFVVYSNDQILPEYMVTYK